MDKESIERLQRVTDKKGQIVLLELTCPAFGETVRVVNARSNRTFGGIEYIALPFYFKLPDRRQDGAARAQLAIDNVGRGITENFEKVQPGDSVMAKIIVAHDDEALRVIHYCYLPMSNLSVTQEVATADCGISFVTSQKAVKLRNNQFLTPGIF